MSKGQALFNCSQQEGDDLFSLIIQSGNETTIAAVAALNVPKTEKI